MNCCNSYGQCSQGANCAARTADSCKSPVPPEAGNVWFLDDALAAKQAVDINAAISMPPFTRAENWFIGGTIFLICITWIATLFFGLGYSWERFGSGFISWILANAAAWGLPG